MTHTFNRFISVVLVLLAVLVAPAAAQSDPKSADPFGTPKTAERPEAGDPPKVEISAHISKPQVSPGDTFVVAVVLDHMPGWHTNLNEPIVPKEMGNFPPVATTIETDLPENGTLEQGPVQWPEPHAVQVQFTGAPVEFLVFEGTAIAYIPLRVSDTAALGTTIEVPITVRYQSCDDMTCDMPTTELVRVSMSIVQPDSATITPGGSLDQASVFSGFNPAVFADPESWGSVQSASQASSAPQRTLLGVIPVPSPESPAGVAMLFVLAMLGGFVLNLTPCVLPVIPIKIMTISQHAGTKGKGLVLGLAMAFGVIAFWAGIGLPVAFISGFVDPSMLFGIWWVTLGIGVLIAAMGVGIMGMFQITLPQKIYMINPKADSLSGSFMFGVMTAVLGLPCFGFVAGALLAGAATMPAWVVMTVFVGLGVGMAFPYAVLAAAPKLVDKLPRTGPASELVKQVMGLLLLAAAAYFIGAGVHAFVSERPTMSASLPWWFKPIHWWFVALFALSASGWLVFKTFTITKSPVRRGAFTLVGLVIAGLALMLTVDQTANARHDIWVAYSPELLLTAAESDKVVVLDFTAEWCLNCKTLEATVLSAASVREQLLSADVIPVKADLTSTKAVGWDKLRELGQTGIPLLVISGPGQSEPWMANAYTPEMVVNAIKAARGEPVAMGR